ncbi:MAG: hypothetical protein DI551_01875 [Micavibrio aeruginosavorus]|uniref:Uncharacterized protein n=1 Tax=Micavibrio aeruginosavorus TaxID=349221 RepID=A0A2W5QA31_9BACT|nr:MAG: hypothetical protein DI551_01875 [Micavibrio aeruginosavorus]
MSHNNVFSLAATAKQSNPYGRMDIEELSDALQSLVRDSRNVSKKTRLTESFCKRVFKIEEPTSMEIIAAQAAQCMQVILRRGGDMIATGKPWEAFTLATETLATNNSHFHCPEIGIACADLKDNSLKAMENNAQTTSPTVAAL